MLEQYFPVLLFIIVGVGIGLVLLTVGSLVGKLDHRLLNDQEWEMAQFIFRDTLPDRSQIVLTNNKIVQGIEIADHAFAMLLMLSRDLYTFYDNKQHELWQPPRPFPGIELNGRNAVIIGVGGIFTADDVRAKFEAGANLVQVYTGMIYEGPSWPSRLARELAERGTRRAGRGLSLCIRCLRCPPIAL